MSHAQIVSSLLMAIGAGITLLDFRSGNPHQRKWVIHKYAASLGLLMVGVGAACYPSEDTGMLIGVSIGFGVTNFLIVFFDRPIIQRRW